MLEAQQAAIAEMLSDGLPRRVIVSRLMDTFGLSQATAYRRLQEAEAESPGIDALEAGAEMANLPAEVLAAMLRTLRRVEARGDDEAVLKTAAAMAAAIARLKVARIPDP